MKLIVNIRGCNGSGKSTIPMGMMDDPDMYVVYKHIPNRKSKIGIATVFPSYGWVALGTYFNKTGGMDCLPNNEVIQKTFWYVLKKYPDYDMLLEGVIASTISSTYINLFKEAEERYPDRKVVVLSFNTPVDVCLERIYKRNGGKPIKEDVVILKWGIVQRAAKKFKDSGFSTIEIDNSNITKDNMLKKFLRIAEKYRKEE